jgi:hypothetical protein
MRLRRLLFIALAGVLLAPAASFAQGSPCCVLADNGSGTANLPPNCAVGYTGSGQIVDGMGPGTIQIAARLVNFFNVVQGPGGGLGGEFQRWNASLELNLTGTGAYLGYNRFVIMTVQGETHSAPRTPFAPVQSFNTDLFQLQGQLPPGDPDFDLLRITGGTAFGMPSPGQTTLTQSGSGWAVDSFFDITFRVDFVGSPVGPFAGRSGSTNNQLRRFDMCHENPTPAAPSSWGRLKASYR